MDSLSYGESWGVGIPDAEAHEVFPDLRGSFGVLYIGDNAQGMVGMKLTRAVRVYARVVRQFNGVTYSSK